MNASDNVGVSRVELYIGGALFATDTLAPYSFSWDSTTRADGNVTILNPTNGSTVRGTNVAISASATDNEAVAGMSVYIDGVLRASSSNGSIALNWNIKKVSSGVHTIRVDAKDRSGNVGSKNIQVYK